MDIEGKILNFNQRFVEMWKIPEAIIAARSDEKAIEFVLSQLKDPQSFIAKVKELYHSSEKSFDILEFIDGRVFERYSQSQDKAGKTVGRVWSFLDVTEKRQGDAKEKGRAEELERMNKLMIDRELKMIELKKENDALKAQAKPA